MKRYELKSKITMAPNLRGTWVIFEDAQFEITRLNNKIKGLENTIDYLKQQFNKKRDLSGDH